MDLQYGTIFTSPFWCPEFLCVLDFFLNCCTIVPKGPYAEQTRFHRPRQSFPLYSTHKTQRRKH